MIVKDSGVSVITRIDRLPTPNRAIKSTGFVRSLKNGKTGRTITTTELNNFIAFIASLKGSVCTSVLGGRFGGRNVAASCVVSSIGRPAKATLVFITSDNRGYVTMTPKTGCSLLPNSVARFSGMVSRTSVVIVRTRVPCRAVGGVTLSTGGGNGGMLFGPTPTYLVSRRLVGTVSVLIIGRLRTSFVSKVSCASGGLRRVTRALLGTNADGIMVALKDRNTCVGGTGRAVRLPNYGMGTVSAVTTNSAFYNTLTIIYTGGRVSQRTLGFTGATTTVTIAHSNTRPSVPALSRIGRFVLRGRLTLSFGFWVW